MYIFKTQHIAFLQYKNISSLVIALTKRRVRYQRAQVTIKWWKTQQNWNGTDVQKTWFNYMASWKVFLFRQIEERVVKVHLNQYIEAEKFILKQ